MDIMWSPLASASLVFLVLYALLLIVLVTLLSKCKALSKLLWFILLVHILVRLTAQSCGLAIGTGDFNIRLLIAYSLAAAEGQYLLLLCAAHSLIAWQQHHWHRCWSLLVIVFDTILIAANVVIVTSAGLNSAARDNSSLGPTSTRGGLATAKWMMTGGQSAFWLLTLALLVPILVTIHRHRQRRYDKDMERRGSEISLTTKAQEEPVTLKSRRPWYGHPVLLLLLLVWPFLVVRGIWGVLQAAVPDLNVSLFPPPCPFFGVLLR